MGEVDGMERDEDEKFRRLGFTSAAGWGPRILATVNDLGSLFSLFETYRYILACTLDTASNTKSSTISRRRNLSLHESDYLS